MPRKPKFITLLLKSHRDQAFQKPVNINYFESLDKVIEILDIKIEHFYNKYGQIMPLSYQVPKTGLVLYLDPPIKPPCQWDDILKVPTTVSKKDYRKIIEETECLLSDSE